MVVVVRDSGTTWVAQTAATIRDTGALTGLITGQLTAAERAELTPLVDRLTEVDEPTDPHQLANAARTMSTGHPLAGVFAAFDSTVVAAARAAELLGVGRAPSAGLARARNKYASRLAMVAAGVPTPRFALIHSAAEAAAVAARVTLPAVVKPLSGVGSHLVERVSTDTELARAYEKIAARLLDVPQLRALYTTPLHDTGDPIDPATTFLVESQLAGPEYGIDVIIRDGEVEHLPVMGKLLDDRFFEFGFVCPPLDLDPVVEKRILDTVADAVRAVGLDNTVVNVDLIVDEVLGPTVVELNGRPGGQLIGTLYDLRTGVNISAEAIGLACGLPAARSEPTLPIPLATLSLFAEATGRLRAVHGLDEVAELPDVVRVVPGASPGDLLTDDYEMFAVTLIVAGFLDEEDLVTCHAEAKALVRFDVDPL